MDNFFETCNIAEKLRVAIDDLRVGHALHIAFRGLENGVCTVDVVYNGESIVFVNKMPVQEPAETLVPIEPETLVGDAGETDVTVVSEEEKPRRRRRKT